MLEEDNASLFLASNVSRLVSQILDDRAYQIQQTQDVLSSCLCYPDIQQNNSQVLYMGSFLRSILLSLMFIVALVVAFHLDHHLAWLPPVLERPALATPE